MFKLSLLDKNATPLQIGDLVKVINNRHGFTLYTEIKWIEDEKIISPFHTFSFHSFEKVTELPEGAKKSNHSPKYDVWYLAKSQEGEEGAERYLMSWRACEHNLQNRCFIIEPL